MSDLPRFPLRFSLLLLALALATAPAAAQPAPSPGAAADGAAPDVTESAGPAAPPWVTVPPDLPPAWRIQDASDDTVTFTDGETRLALVRQTGSANQLLGALTSQLAAEVGGGPAIHHLPVGGRWVEGRLMDAPGRAGPRGVVAVRRLSDDAVVTAVIRGGKRGRSVGHAADILARLRFAGEDDPAPYAPLDLEGRPDARINPVGLFVTLPSGWKPDLDKKPSQFWLRHDSARLRYAKAAATDLRALSKRAKVAEAYPGHTVQPSLWRPPGAYRSWQLVKREGDDVTEVREVHLVRWKKLDDWSYHLVEVDRVDPRRGFAHVHSLLSRLKMIP